MADLSKKSWPRTTPPPGQPEAVDSETLKALRAAFLELIASGQLDASLYAAYGIKRKGAGNG